MAQLRSVLARLLAVVPLIAGFSCGEQSGQAVRQENAEFVELEPIDLGTINDTRRSSVTIPNLTHKTWRGISATATCGCLRVHLHQDNVEPGDDLRLDIAVTTTGQVAGERSETVYVRISEPTDVIFSQKIRARIAPRPYLDPSICYVEVPDGANAVVVRSQVVAAVEMDPTSVRCEVGGFRHGAITAEAKKRVGTLIHIDLEFTFKASPQRADYTESGVVVLLQGDQELARLGLTTIVRHKSGLKVLPGGTVIRESADGIVRGRLVATNLDERGDADRENGFAFAVLPELSSMFTKGRDGLVEFSVRTNGQVQLFQIVIARDDYTTMIPIAVVPR